MIFPEQHCAVTTPGVIRGHIADDCPSYVVA
jgi:hypothetical protein